MFLTASRVSKTAPPTIEWVAKSPYDDTVSLLLMFIEIDQCSQEHSMILDVVVAEAEVKPVGRHELQRRINCGEVEGIVEKR